jgi:hypothetical protein
MACPTGAAAPERLSALCSPSIGGDRSNDAKTRAQKLRRGNEEVRVLEIVRRDGRSRICRKTGKYRHRTSQRVRRMAATLARCAARGTRESVMRGQKRGEHARKRADDARIHLLRTSSYKGGSTGGSSPAMTARTRCNPQLHESARLFPRAVVYREITNWRVRPRQNGKIASPVAAGDTRASAAFAHPHGGEAAEQKQKTDQSGEDRQHPDAADHGRLARAQP